MQAFGHDLEPHTPTGCGGCTQWPASEGLDSRTCPCDCILEPTGARRRPPPSRAFTAQRPRTRDAWVTQTQGGRAGSRAFCTCRQCPPELPVVFLFWVGCPEVADLLTSGTVKSDRPCVCPENPHPPLRTSPTAGLWARSGRQSWVFSSACLPTPGGAALSSEGPDHHWEAKHTQRLPKPRECQLRGYF